MVTLKEAIRNRRQPTGSTMDVLLLREVYQKIEGIIDTMFADREKTFTEDTSKVRESLKALADSLESEIRKLSDNEKKALMESFTQSLEQKVSDVDATVAETKSSLELALKSFDKKYQDILNNVEKYKGPQGESIKGDKGEPGEDGKSVTKEEILEEIMPEINRIKQEIKQSLRQMKNQKGGGSGGGMGNTEDKAFTGDGSTVAFTLDYNVASNGKAAMVIINGQVQERTTHYSISGKIVTFTTAPIDGDYIWVQYVRT